MSSDPNDASSKVDLERRRVPLERKISLKFKEFRGFITEVSSNLSMGGMFIRTTSPKPVGTIFDFELSLTDDFKLVQGIGEVLWIREVDKGPEQPAGMGIRFLDLSAESRRLIQRIVEEQVAHGGTPFELEPPGFPPPPLPVSQPTMARPTGQSTLFHPTAAPLAAAPPMPPRSAPTTSAAPRTGTAAKPAAPTAPPPRATQPKPAAPPPSPPPPADESFPALDLGDLPDLPVPTLGEARGNVGDSWQGELLDDRAEAEAPEIAGIPEVVVPLPAREPDDVGYDDPTVSWRQATAPGVRPASSALEGTGAGVAPPGAPPPAGGPRGRSLPSGFDEVARAFSESAAIDVRGPTVRLQPPLPAAPPGPLLPSIPDAPPIAPRPAIRTPPPPPRRRSSLLPVAAIAIVVLLAGGAVVYFRFPQLLPEWVGATGGGASPGAIPAVTMDPRVRTVEPEQAGPSGQAPNAGPSSAPAPTQAAGGTGAAGTVSPGLPAAATPLPTGELPRRTAGGASSARFTSVEEIWGQHTAAGTVVTIVTDGAVPADAFSSFRLEDGNPREVVRLRGVDDSYRRTSVPIATPEVKAVRLGYHVNGSVSELHVVIDLASPRVKLLRANPVDNRLELLLSITQ